MDLYPASRRPFDPSALRDPAAIYRGTPFWSLNGALDAAALARGVDQFAAMGMGGFHLHPRTGLSTPYLSPAYFDALRGAISRARDLGLIPWLYDEDRWPSGFAGGLVTRDARFRRRYLSLRPMRAAPYPQEPSQMLAAYRIRLDDAGRLIGSQRQDLDAAEGPEIWFAARQINGGYPWYNDQTYVDTLNPAAIDRFIAVTHEAYRCELGPDFGGAPAIFTDEPMIPLIHRLPHPTARQEVQLPWTDDLPESWRAAWGDDLLDHLPELVWDAASPTPTRWRFVDHVTERFARAYADRIGSWCQAHGIASTGHLMAEESLQSQEMHLGEAMRHYRSYQVPGIDILCDRQELTTAKQAVSVARQDGRCGALSELYGVMDWDPTFAQHKTQGDWQAALGITVRVHHLVHHTLAGDAKRDYPASLGRHWPAHARYRLVEDHFARLNTVLTRGEAAVRVAVVHPIESQWLTAGQDAPTQRRRLMRDRLFQNLAEWLVDGLIDFDYVSESLLPQQCPEQRGPALTVGHMAYDVVVLAGLDTIRSTTLDRLEAFRKAGGAVLVVGSAPRLVDARPDPRPASLATQWVACDRASVLEALDPWRQVQVEDPNRTPRPGLVHQLRRDGDDAWLFVASRHRPQDGDPPCWWDGQPSDRHDSVRVRGRWTPSRIDTASGAVVPAEHHHADGWTSIPWRAEPQAHLLVRLQPAPANRAPAPVRWPAWRERTRLAGPVPVTLHEPNALVLTRGIWRLDGGAWQDADEILRIDDRIRRELGWPCRHDSKQFAQPWARAAAGLATHRVSLRCSVVAATRIRLARLALERAAQAVIRLDDRVLPSQPDGWWVDEAVTTVPLPELEAGSHTLEIELPFTDTAGLEWLHVIGDFGVALQGRQASLTDPVRQLDWGDICHQGLPYYGGDLTYHTTIHAEGATGVRIFRFGGPVAEVAIDGGPAHPLAWWPYRADLGVLHGEHHLDVRVYGNRRNQFGALHNCGSVPLNPRSWYSVNDHWTDGHVLRPMGVLVEPVLESRDP
jgi:hypothetical protein